MQRAAVVMFVTATNTAVMAQPSTVAPIDPESEESPAKPVYSRALAQRPLLLPDGVFEVDTSLVVFNDKRLFFDAATKLHTSAFELAIGLSYQLGTRRESDPDLQTLYVSGLRQIIACRVPQLAVGAQIVGTTLFGELPGVAPSLIAAYKHTVRPWFALQGFGLLGYEYSRSVDLTTSAGDGMESTQHGLATSLGVRAQLQPSEVIAFELRGSVAYRQDLEDYTAIGLTSFGSQTLGGMLLVSANGTVDFFLSYDAVLREGDRQREAILFGAAIRRL